MADPLSSHRTASRCEVREVVRSVMPQHVMVELCTARRQRLEAQGLGPETCSILPGWERLGTAGNGWEHPGEGQALVAMQNMTIPNQIQ